MLDVCGPTTVFFYRGLSLRTNAKKRLIDVFDVFTLRAQTDPKALPRDTCDVSLKAIHVVPSESYGLCPNLTP